MPVRCIACAKMFPEKKMVGELCKRCHKQAPERLAKAAEYQQKRREDKVKLWEENQNTTPPEPTAPSPSPESQKVSGLLMLYQCLYQPSPNDDIRQGKIYWALGGAILVGGGILGFFTGFADSLDVDDFGMWPGYFFLIGLGGAAIFIPLGLYKFGILTWQKILAFIVQLIVVALLIWSQYGD